MKFKVVIIIALKILLANFNGIYSSEPQGENTYHSDIPADQIQNLECDVTSTEVNSRNMLREQHSPYKLVKVTKGFRIHGTFQPPLEDVLVEIIIYRLDDSSCQEKVASLNIFDTDGSFTLEQYEYYVKERGQYRIEFRSLRYRDYTQEFYVQNLTDSKKIDIPVIIEYRIQATIVDEQGNKLYPSSESPFVLVGKDQCGNLLFEGFSPFSSIDKTFVFKNCDNGNRTLLLTITGQGYHQSTEEIDFSENRIRKRGIILKPIEGLSSVEGTIKNADTGEPIKDIAINVSEDNDDYFNITFTDGNGLYSFKHLKPGNYSLYIGDPTLIIELDNAIKDVKLGRDEYRVVDFTLRIGGGIIGHLTDMQGRNLSAAEVIIKPVIEGEQLKQYTNLQGEFDFIAIPGGEYEVTVSYLGNIYKLDKINVPKGEIITKSFKLRLK